MKSHLKKPRILLYDIETSPNIAYVWGKWEQNVIDFKKEWEILSFAYKWLDEDKVYCHSRLEIPSEKKLVKKLWDLFNECTINVAHNGNAFDNKKVKAKFLEHNFKPPSPYKTVDTKQIASNQFKFNSNSMDDLGKTLGLGRKIKHSGFDLWLGCMAGKVKSWREMIKYNKQDVILLEKVYLKLRAWAPGHPNMSQINREACPVCRSEHVYRRGSETVLGGYKLRYQCRSCGRWFSSSKKFKFK